MKVLMIGLVTALLLAIPTEAQARTQPACGVHVGFTVQGGVFFNLNALGVGRALTFTNGISYPATVYYRFVTSLPRGFNGFPITDHPTSLSVGQSRTIRVPKRRAFVLINASADSIHITTCRT